LSDDHDHQPDGAGIADDETVRRASPAVRIVAIVVVIAMVLSAAAVVIGILTSDDTQVDAADVDASGAASGEVAPAVTTPTRDTRETTTTQRAPCAPLPPPAIAEVLGVASVEVDPDGASPEGAGCRVVADPWTVSYSMVEATEPDPSLAIEPLPIGDRAYLRVDDDRSGNWSATGAVVVGDRMLMMTLGSSARGVDTYPGDQGPAVEPQVRERAVALLQALADRL
jgi:hypothetical protein